MKMRTNLTEKDTDLLHSLLLSISHEENKLNILSRGIHINVSLDSEEVAQVFSQIKQYYYEKGHSDGWTKGFNEGYEFRGLDL